MRKSKQTVKKSIKQHTPTERLVLRHKKRKEGPSAMRRKERRLSLQSKGFQGVELNVTMIDEVSEMNIGKSDQMLAAASELGIPIMEIKP